MMTSRSNQPPAILIGGGVNALSIARTLGRKSVPVYCIAAEKSDVRYSRYCTWIGPSVAGTSNSERLGFLMGRGSRELEGGVLLATSDDGLEIIAHHRETLSTRYLLDASNPGTQRAMLNKLATYEAAQEAGVPTPRFWTGQQLDDIGHLDPAPRFPLVIKPFFSHTFEKQFGQKLFIVHSFDELLERFRFIGKSREEVMLVELIPGRDDRLCSYYTYMDEAGQPAFHFTKRISRRHPVVFGNGCNHVTDCNPKVQALALRLFQHVGLRGVANAEFKYDERDGELKLIECNARFTAANCLLHHSGIDLASFVYDRILGKNPRLPASYRAGVRLWYPVEDAMCAWKLYRTGELSPRKWWRSIRRRFVLPRFSWRDPGPSIAHEAARLKRGVQAILKSWIRPTTRSMVQPKTTEPESHVVAVQNPRRPIVLPVIDNAAGSASDRTLVEQECLS